MPSWPWLFETALKIAFSAIVISFVVVLLWAVVTTLVKGGKP